MSAAGINQASRAELARVVRGRRFITPTDAAAELGTDARAAARKLAYWADAGWMRRVRRGLYIPVPVEAQNPGMWAEDAMAIAAVVWAPCYFTGWTAANHWALTEQTFRTVVLKTTTRVRQSKVTLIDRNYLISHAAPTELEWGLSSIWHEEIRLHLADPARTVIDCFDAPKLGGGIRHSADILREYLKQNTFEKLVDYGDRLENGAVFKRLGFALDQLGLTSETQLRAACLDRLTAGVALLDPQGPDRGERNPTWRVRVNARIGQDDQS